jgi:two-component system response regulator HydG
VDVRIVAATNKDLLEAVKQGKFREDLFYRLNVIPIHLPPLKERPNDIPLQARYFLKRFAGVHGKDITEFGPETMRQLSLYDWPGNVRELENCIEHAVVLARGTRIDVSDLPPALHKTAVGDLDNKRYRTIEESEAELLQETLRNSKWNKKLAAERLGISRNTLYRKLQKYQIAFSNVQ